jgi:hypothetical protein
MQLSLYKIQGHKRLTTCISKVNNVSFHAGFNIGSYLNPKENYMKIDRKYLGEWRILEMSNWDREFIDLVAPGHLTVSVDGIGHLAFGVVEADLDFQMEEVGGTEQIAFSFEGTDEGDEVSGRGWAVVDSNIMNGWLGFHLGDETAFKAKRHKEILEAGFNV